MSEEFGFGEYEKFESSGKDDGQKTNFIFGASQSIGVNDRFQQNGKQDGGISVKCVRP